MRPGLFSRRPPVAYVRASRSGEPSDSGLVIEGRLECSLAHHEKVVTVGKRARVRASVQAESVTVFGELTGNIYSNGSVLLSRGCMVNGDIFCPSIVVEDGVKFGGNINSNGLVLLSKGSEVNGAISCPRIVIEEGAIFDGCINTEAGSGDTAHVVDPGQNSEQDDDAENMLSHVPVKTAMDSSISASPASQLPG